jgi:chorismate mutase/prephenate dehydratase
MSSYEEEIGELREEINRLNVEIVERLSERVDVALRIGEVKKRHGRPIVDRSREAKVYRQVRGLAQGCSLDPEGVELVFREIIRLCTEAEQEEEG